MEILLESIEEIDKVARQIIDEAGDIEVWTFEGQMGAGKTTLIKSICSELGVKDNVNSPTFSLVNEYADSQGNSLYHFDIYRIDDVEEALDLGLEEYFYSGSKCFIEWPQLIEDHIPEKYLSVNISVTPEQTRQIHLTKHG